MKIITVSILSFRNFKDSTEVAKDALHWFESSRKPLIDLGVRYFIDTDPEDFDGDKPYFEIKAEGPKPYLTIDRLRIDASDIRAFCIGRTWDRSSENIDDKMYF